MISKDKIKAFLDEADDADVTPLQQQYDKIKALAFPFLVALIMACFGIIGYFLVQIIEEVHQTHDDVIKLTAQINILIPQQESTISFLQGQIQEYKKQESGKSGGGGNKQENYLPSGTLPDEINLKHGRN